LVSSLIERMTGSHDRDTTLTRDHGFSPYSHSIMMPHGCGLSAPSSRLLRGFHPRGLDGDIGAEEIGYGHNPDQGAIVVQHGETAYFVLEQ
jgi:hypothetical protein